ncbi:MAG: alpha/beta hydrolase [Brevibacillus sp.]|nr:alpha/beta hydrolase [Brevibacillus sp.]
MADAKGIVVLVHGTAEHSGRYEHVAAYLNRCGYSVYSGDLPGWGRSTGRKGHIAVFQDYLDVVEGWVSDAEGEKRSTGCSVYLMGHSLGGLIAVRFIQRYGQRHLLDGLILSSPCLKLRIVPPVWKVRLAQTLNRLWPTLRLSNEIAPWQVTRDEAVREAYQTDPFVYNKVSVRWFCELQQAMQAALAEADMVTLPLLVVQAGDDQLVDPGGAEHFVNRAAAGDKTFRLFPELYHEVLNEPEREMVLAEIADWLTRQERLLGKCDIQYDY